MPRTDVGEPFASKSGGGSRRSLRSFAKAASGVTGLISQPPPCRRCVSPTARGSKPATGSPDSHISVACGKVSGQIDGRRLKRRDFFDRLSEILRVVRPWRMRFASSPFSAAAYAHRLRFEAGCPRSTGACRRFQDPRPLRGGVLPGTQHPHRRPRSGNRPIRSTFSKSRPCADDRKLLSAA